VWIYCYLRDSCVSSIQMRIGLAVNPASCIKSKSSDIGKRSSDMDSSSDKDNGSFGAGIKLAALACNLRYLDICRRVLGQPVRVLSCRVAKSKPFNEMRSKTRSKSD